ncbi:hypothetical protein [Streptomyces lavenduligriseus]|uniref:hypothetical protein n=1 Tax=Streptomyces lavenduligriseus TaxID=67315 RepID=UPI001FD7C8FA|nr:hypothetical protein [Streptomyces lavenduligriseus]
MPRRLLPLVVAALVSVAGCTTVNPAPQPGAAGSRRALPPDAETRPSALRAPVGAPPAAPRPPPAAPAPQPRAKRRPPVRHQAPRPRTASRPPAAVMRDLCRRADGVAAPEIVRLCRETYG